MDGVNNISEDLMAEINAAIDAIEQEEQQPLQENSETLLVKENTIRFNSAEWFNQIQKTSVAIAGCGGIGSWTSLLIARLNPMWIFLFDNDTGEEVNLAGQLFSNKDVGRYKTNACVENIANFCNYSKFNAYNRRFGCVSIVHSKNLICGFDNMAARKDAFKQWFNANNGNSEAIFIDGRLNAEDFQIFCITGDNESAAHKYSKQYLFDDKDVENAVCSYKQTSFCASMIASLITNLFVNYAANIALGDFRCLPFKISYDATTMLLKTEV